MPKKKTVSIRPSTGGKKPTRQSGISNMLKELKIADIKIGKRHRRDMGDLGSLVESMKTYGQLSPVVVTRTHELIAGHRRLQAAQRLGWHSIAVTYVDQASEDAKLEMELQENVHRKDFSPEELLEGYRRLEKLRRPSIARRIAMFFSNLFRRLFRRKQRDQVDAPTAPALPAPSSSDGEEPDDTSPQDYGI